MHKKKSEIGFVISKKGEKWAVYHQYCNFFKDCTGYKTIVMDRLERKEAIKLATKLTEVIRIFNSERRDVKEDIINNRFEILDFRKLMCKD